MNLRGFVEYRHNAARPQRRYGLLKPQRTDGGHVVGDDDIQQVKILDWVKKRTDGQLNRCCPVPGENNCSPAREYAAAPERRKIESLAPAYL